MALALEVSSILNIKEVSVVQSVDAAALQDLLVKLLSKQTAVEDQLRQQQQDIEELKDHSAALTQASRAANAASLEPPHTSALPPLGTKHISPSEAALHALQNDARVAVLERQQFTIDSASVAPSPTAAAADSNLDSAVITTTAAKAAPVSSGSDAEAQLDMLAELKVQQERLAEQLKSLQDNLQHQLTTGLASKADTAAVQNLQQLAESKADQSSIDLLKKKLDSKADRSELDALLLGLSGTTAGGVAASDAGAASMGDDAAASSADMRAVKLQLVLLQDRLANKVDASALEEVAAGLAAAKRDLAVMMLAIEKANGQLADLNRFTAALQNSQSSAAQAASTPITTTVPSAAGATKAQIVESWEQDMQQVLMRLSAIEVSLSASTSLVQGPTVRRTISSNSKMSPDTTEVPDTSVIPPFGAPDVTSMLQQLASDIADLRVQVAKLKHSISRSDASGRAGAAPAGVLQTAVGGGAADSEGVLLSHTVSMLNGLAGGIEDASAADAAFDGLQPSAVAPAVDQEDGDDDAEHSAPAMFADLVARIAGLQALVDSLAASKADRGEVERVQTMLADTATQSDTDLLRHKLDAQQQQLARLQSLTQRLTGSTPPAAVRPDTISSPKGSAAAGGGGIWPEPSLMSPTTRGRPGTPQFAPWDSGKSTSGTAGTAAGGDGFNAAGDLSLAGGMFGSTSSAQEEELLAGLEQLAQAVCLLATGQAAASADNFSFKGSKLQGGGAAQDQAGAGVSCTAAAGTNSSSSSRDPHLARLKRLLQQGQIGRKLDWFDPTLLQKMISSFAQRLAAAEALIKNAHGGSSVLSGSGGSADVETRLRKLAAEVRMLKDRMGELKPVQGGWRPADGDHTMLAAKPLAGYRCMACDRPLGSLDPNPGPYLPSGQMPLPVAAEPAAAAATASGKLPPAGGSSRRSTVQEAVAASAGLSDPAALDPAGAGRRLTGPQSWYTTAHGPPADQLPKADVGPHLPPGGWRGSLPRAEDGSVLPVLVARGGASSPQSK